MRKRILWSLSTAILFSAAASISSCENPGYDPITPVYPSDPNVDLLLTKVSVDVPTAVRSSFDDTSVGAALVRRLPKVTSEIEADTKMVLIKGEDILSKPYTEWLEAAKIYLTGGYIAVEKPHNAHLVHFMEQMIDKIAQAETELLTGDLGDGVTATITPPNETATEASVRSAHVFRLQTRVANLETRASILGDIEAQPVAELVIFAMDRYYSCDPYQNGVIGTSHGGSDQEETVSQDYKVYNSGLVADGAAQWLNSQQKTVAEAKALTRAGGAGAINELMSASEEHTVQRRLVAADWNGINRHKENAYLETVRVWGAHNMDNNKDYYYVRQKAVASVGGKQKDDARFDLNKTLYAGPYEKDEYIDADWNYEDHHYTLYYGAWFQEGEFKLGLSGNGSIKLEDAIPTTDNNNTSTSVAVGEMHTETNTIGASIAGIISSTPGVNIGANYSHGWTDGTTYTMTTTTNVKEIKVTKNTEGNTVIWVYQNTLDVPGKSDKDEHPLVPDAVIYDVNIDNQACWSVSNPEGAYTLQTNRKPKMQSYFCNVDENHEDWNTAWPSDGEGISYTLLIPNRATQTWRMDVTFPEIGQAGHEGQKAQLIEALQRHFPDLYQPTLSLADQTEESENTIKSLYAMSQQLILHSDGSKTMKEYAKDMGISQYTILWYTTDGKHNKYDVTVTAD